MKRFQLFNRLGAGLAMIALAAAPLAAQTEITPREQKLADRVRHEIVMLPYLSVFDNVGIQVVNDRVVLTGQVIRPVLKSDIGRVVERLEGVEKVDNKIEVLPLSRFDDSIRLSVLQAIYGSPQLQRYGLNPQGPIRILVKNGNVTLEGIVLNEMDRNIAGIRANGVSGVFSVTNNLRVEMPSAT